MSPLVQVLVATFLIVIPTVPAIASGRPGDGPPPRPVEVLKIEGVALAYPRWMPAGDRIVFQGNQTGGWQLYAAGSDGGDVVQLTSGDAASYAPDPSPDGSRIAFVSDRSGNEDVFIMAADGTGVRNLTSHPARDIHPYWTPDGRLLLFNSTRSDPAGYLPHVFELAVEGGEVRQLTEGEDYETCARMSPAGDTIVYLQTWVGDDQHDDVCLLDREGTLVRNLTADAHRDGWPAWFPDGRHIVFASRRSGTFALYSIGADGTGLRQLTFPEPPVADARPVVSPDGLSVLFNRDLGEGTVAIMRLSVDRQGSRAVSTRAGWVLDAHGGGRPSEHRCRAGHC